MKLVKQNSPTTCGQACVATVLGITLEESIELFGHSGTTSDYEILKALGKHFMGEMKTDLPIFPPDTKVILGKPPKDILAIVKHKEKNGNREHWTVWNRGDILDPACINGKLWPITKYIEVNRER